MTTEELRAKFETWYSHDFFNDMAPPPPWSDSKNTYEGFCEHMAWNAYWAAHAYRDAEVEALKRDAERYRWLLDTGLDDGNGWHLTQELPNGMEEIHLFADRINDAIDAAMRKESK